MSRTLLGELQHSFACSLSLIIHFCPMVLEITLSTDCFLVPVMREVGASPHPSVAGRLSGTVGRWQQSREGKGFMAPGNTTCPISGLFKLCLQRDRCEECALLLPQNGRALLSRTQWISTMVLGLEWGLCGVWTGFHTMLCTRNTEEHLTAVRGNTTPSEMTDHWCDSLI